MTQPQSATSSSAVLGTHVLATDRGPIPWPFTSVWRAAIPTTTGLAPLEEILPSAKAVPLASKGERALLQALATDDGHAVMELTARPGEHQLAAALLASLRLADHLPDQALTLLSWIRSSGANLSGLRFVRRYLPNLMVFAQVSPELRIITSADNAGVPVLEAELLDQAGRPTEALAVRKAIPPSAVGFLVSAVEALAHGAFEEVLAQTERVDAHADDVQACLAVLRARAMQGLRRHGPADAQFAAVASVVGLPQSLRLWILRGQVELHTASGRKSEAQLAEAERSALAQQLFGGAPGAELPTPPPQPTPENPIAPVAEPALDEPGVVGAGGEAADEAPRTPSVGVPPMHPGRSRLVAIEDAQARVRRQPRWAETPGTLGGRPQEDFQEEVDELIGGGHLEAAESLLLALLDALDDLVDDRHTLDPTHYISLAGLFAQRMMPAEELAVLQRLVDAYRRAGLEPPPEVLRQMDRVDADLRRVLGA